MTSLASELAPLQYLVMNLEDAGYPRVAAIFNLYT
jgi:hypothetical protein